MSLLDSRLVSHGIQILTPWMFGLQYSSSWMLRASAMYRSCVRVSTDPAGDRNYLQLAHFGAGCFRALPSLLFVPAHDDSSDTPHSHRETTLYNTCSISTTTDSLRPLSDNSLETSRLFRRRSSRRTWSRNASESPTPPVDERLLRNC